MLDATELAQIQSDLVAAVCDKTCVIQRKTVTSDSMGTDTEVWNTIATTVAGMSQPSAGQLANYDFKIGSLAAWQVHLPVGTNVQEQDHLIIGGQTLDVQVLLDPHSYPGLLPVIASEVK
jgi:hypothetical protein